MNRRNFLTAGIAAKPFASETIVQKPDKNEQQETIRTNSGINPYAGSWTTNEVIHLLKRTMFGAKKADVDFFKTMTMSQAVDYLLTVPAAAPLPPVKTYTIAMGGTTPATDPDYTLNIGDTWVNNYTNDGSVNANRRASFKAWWTGLMLNQDRNILEKLTLFWHNHFSTETADVSYGISCYKHNSLLRQSALGNFKQLVKAITIDPAMLRYLNNELNTKTAPDENYARELQELFTVGKNLGIAGYTEDDVKTAAKVLTGYRVNYTTLAYYFDANRHETSNKQFSPFYNNTIVTGRTGANGALELDDMLNMIFNVDEVSKCICRKLYRFFVYYTIDAATEANVIVPLAQLFKQSNYEIKPVLARLLKSEHFFDMLNQGCFIKPPIDLVIGMCREFGVVLPPVTDYVNAYFMYGYVQTIAANCQQNIGDPPDVAGWKAYYQVPQFHEIWINSDTLPKRNQFTDLMAVNGYTRNGKNIRIDPVAFAKTLPDPADPNKLIADTLVYLLRMPLSQASRNQVKKDILLTGQAQDYYWSDAWAAHIANPNDTVALTTVRTRLQNLFKYLMALSEYQLS